MQSFANFVEFVDYKTELKDCCNVTREKHLFEPYNQFFHEELIKCQNNYHTFFKYYELNIGHIDQAISSLVTNDCLMHSRFENKYLTNLDFDEFILPRKFKTHLYRSIDISTDSQMCESFNNFAIKLNQNYNMIDFINSLKKTFNSSIAQFTFENFQLLSKYSTLIEQLKKILRKKKLIYHSNDADLEFNFSVPEYLEKIRKLIILTDCLNDTFIKLEPIYRNFVGSIINNRMGKSIFFTDNTLTIGAHSSQLIAPNTQRIMIPLTIGNVIHIRRKDTEIKSKFNDDELNIDIEYLIFLKSVF